MKFFVVSDIHGDSYWCKKAIKTYKESGADRLVLLGDILYHGPRNDLPSHYAPKEVISLLNPLASSIIAVRGNCDAEVDQMVLDFPIMADYTCIVSGGVMFFLTHGHIYGPEKLPKSIKEGDVLLSGHTHIAGDIIKDGIRFMNPGSPSIPKGETKPSYIIIEDGKAKLIPFDQSLP